MLQQQMEDYKEWARCHHPDCVVCGEKNPFGMHLEFSRIEQNKVIAGFTPGKYLQGYKGIVHGGVLASMLDGVMVHCLFYHLLEAYTVSMNLEYKMPVFVEKPLVLRAELIERKRVKVFLKASIEQEQIIKVSADACFAVFGEKHRNLMRAGIPG
jgi:acyl-coenzyme A thioesterase PaaI-like protein